MDTSKTSEQDYTKPSVTAEPTVIPVDEREEKPCPDCGKTWYSWAPHSCYPVSDINKIQPNRFDPFEALDTISRTATDSMNVVKDGVLQPVTDQMRLNTNLIGFEVHALRAYLSGMER